MANKKNKKKSSDIVISANDVLDLRSIKSKDVDELLSNADRICAWAFQNGLKLSNATSIGTVNDWPDKGPSLELFFSRN